MVADYLTYFRLFAKALTLIAVVAQCVGAQTHLRLEVGDRGMATATVSLEAQPTPKSAPAILRTLALPFELDETYRVSKRDDIEVSVLSNGDDYCLLMLMVANMDAGATIRIDNAFNLVDERAQNRVKLACDSSYSYLKQHRGILKLPTTISEFDITVALPKKYEKDQLSFEPARDKWTEDNPGKEYSLPANTAKVTKSSIWIAFPSPFESGFHMAQISISILIGLFILGLEGKYAIERKIGNRTLIIALALTVVAIFLSAYFCFTLPMPLEFLAWAAGPLIPLVVAPFICIWLLVVSRFEAEISGSITIDGERAKYVTVTLVNKDAAEESTVKKTNVKADGSYRFFLLCGKGRHTACVVASGSGTSGGSSADFEFSAKTKLHVPVIDIQRIQIRAEKSVSATVVPEPGVS